MQPLQNADRMAVQAGSAARATGRELTLMILFAAVMQGGSKLAGAVASLRKARLEARAERALRKQLSAPNADVSAGLAKLSVTARFRRLTGVAKRAEWAQNVQGVKGPGVRQHFDKHGQQVGARTVREYDLSARETIANGTPIRYRDRGTGEPRVGYWDSDTGLFTATSQEGKVPIIRTHFPMSWDEIMTLPGVVLVR
jgi:hypothetical protein